MSAFYINLHILSKYWILVHCNWKWVFLFSSIICKTLKYLIKINTSYLRSLNYKYWTLDLLHVNHVTLRLPSVHGVVKGNRQISCIQQVFPSCFFLESTYHYFSYLISIFMPCMAVFCTLPFFRICLGKSDLILHALSTMFHIHLPFSLYILNSLSLSKLNSMKGYKANPTLVPDDAVFSP